jgi:hypothetical protein
MIAEKKAKLITTSYDPANPFWHVQNSIVLIVIATAIILIAATVSVLNALYSRSSH